jgi:hypothetical protein
MLVGIHLFKLKTQAKHMKNTDTTTTTTKIPTNCTDVVKQRRRKENTEVLAEVLGKAKRSGKHKFPQSTFRLDDDTRNKLEIMRKTLNANQIDIVVFAINQFYNLFENSNNVSRINAIIKRKVQRKNNI